MANYMAEVAKLLGVELGEEFECYGEGYTYCLTDKGLLCNGCHASTILSLLLEGQLEIKRKPWKPKYDEFYWMVSPCGAAACVRWYDNYSDITLYKIGNCYRCKVDAEKNRDKWIHFYESDEVLEVQV